MDACTTALVGSPRPAGPGRRRGRRQHRSGFVLIEVMIVLIVGLVLTVLAYEAGTEMIRTAKAAAAGSEITSILSTGRETALVEHRLFFVIIDSGGTQSIEDISFFRDEDRSGTFDEDEDTLVRQFRPDVQVRLGDGRGSVTSLPELEDGVWAIAFGARGECLDPESGDLVEGFLNVSSNAAERGGWVKYAAITVSPWGGITQENRREAY